VICHKAQYATFFDSARRQWQTGLMNFAAAADELHRQERTRLAAAVTPRPEQLRSMMIGELRNENALMWERLGHTLHTGPDSPELVTAKGERHFITICANPAEPAPAGSAVLRRLRDRVVATGAERGFFVSVRGFTPDAQAFAESAPVQLIDAAAFIRALHRSRKGQLLPRSYKAMCRQCGDIVEHRLASDEARRCANGHFVAPTIAKAELVKPRRPPQPGQPVTSPALAHKPKIIKVRNMSPKAQRRRAIRAHNHKARAIKQQQTAQ
jgi:hypothetical protein